MLGTVSADVWAVCSLAYRVAAAPFEAPVHQRTDRAVPGVYVPLHRPVLVARMSAAMQESIVMKKPETWAPRHMRQLALSRWDGEGGASPSRTTEEPVTAKTSATDSIAGATDEAVTTSPSPVEGWQTTAPCTHPVAVTRS